MAFTMTATVTRTELSLADLDLNDHTNFYVVSVDPGELRWNRAEATSPFYDGAVTVHRNRQRPKTLLTIDATGANQSIVYTNMRALVAAFQQTSFTVNMNFSGQSWAWVGESADVMVQWTENARIRELRPQLTFEFPRDPATEPLL